MSEEESYETNDKKSISACRFERQKILLMQDEEIRRLKSEHLGILRKIHKSEKQADEVNRLYTKNIADLRNKIRSNPYQIVTEKFNLMKNHSEAIENLRQQHEKNLLQVHIDVQKKLQEKLERKSQNKETNEENNKQSANNHSLLKDQTLLHKNDRINEINELRINEYKLYIKKYRQRAKELVKEIETAKKELEEIKAHNKVRVNEAREESRQRAIKNEAASSRTEDIILMQRANSFATLNDARRAELNAIEEMKDKINKTKQSNFILMSKIQDAKASKTEGSEKCQDAVNYLVKELTGFAEKPISTDILKYKDKYREEKYRLNIIKKKVNQSKAELDRLTFENQYLKGEIRKRDYMLYGRNGIHQNFKKKPKKPFKSYGIFAN